MPLSMSATTTERLPVVVLHAVGAWILVSPYSWPNDGSLGKTCPATLSPDRPDVERTVRASSSSTNSRARWRRGERATRTHRTRDRDSRMGRLLRPWVTGLRRIVRPDRRPTQENADKVGVLRIKRAERGC